MKQVFFVIDDSVPMYPVYKLITGIEMAEEHYNCGWNVFEVCDLDTLIHNITNGLEFTVLDITKSTCQWTPFNEEEI
jgi:hypothetical protein